MAVIRDLSKAQLAFQVAGREVDEFLVSRFRGTEGLCQLYRFEIDLSVNQQADQLEPIVGQPAVLSINTDNGPRYFHGLVSRFEMTGETAEQTHFRAELVPAVWMLTHRYSSRIFQGKNVKEIITDVLTQGGIPSDRFSMDRLKATYEPREYCVQYRETDYNFISRLMEEEGIWWFFEQTAEGHVFVMAEKKDDYSPIGDPSDLRYRPPSGMLVEDEHVYRFRLSQAVRPGAVILQDYNFENPKLDLEAKADSGRDPALLFSDYPGEYLSQERGSALAKHRALEFEASRVIAFGQSNCRRLSPGRTFKLIEHRSSGLNGSYVITQVTHQGKESTTRTTTGGNGRTSILDPRVHQSLIAARGSENSVIRELAEALLQIASRFKSGDPTANRALTQWVYHAGQVSKDLPATAAASGGNPMEWLSIPNLISDIAHSSVVDFDAPVYDCSFECLPAAVEYVPPRVTPWPVMRGSQTARVVGPEGEEIHVDKYGRVRVQFNWDLQGSEGGQPKRFGAESSCWMRVCQGSAGGQYGIMFIPRVGQEVVVDFLEGDPDKPMIIGRVFNADHMPPYELPAEKTKSVIKTHSSKGGGGCNEIRFEDLKDKEQLFIQAQRQMDLRVKASHFHSVGGSYHLIVGGEYNGELSGEYREKVFKAKYVHIRGEQRAWIEENDSLAIGKDQSIEVQGNRSTSVGGDDITLVGSNHKVEATATSHVKAADVKIEAAGTIELSAGGSSIILSAGGIWISGSMVYINSGAGAPVAPVEGGLGPAAPEDPSGADSSKPGKDTRYDAPSEEPPVVPPLPEVPGHDFKKDEPQETTWIEIELKDRDGNPVPHEPYRVKDSAQRSFTGALDENGFAHIDGVVPGECEIRFPSRDLSVWRRA